MPKQINVKLGFQANTAQAKKQIQDLQHSLDNLMSSSIRNSATNGFDQQISNAQQSVLKLKTALNNSLNMDTGRLDLSKFNQQLNNSDLSLSKLAKDMTAMGADGQKAFLNLANSIVTAQKPMIESNKLLDSMWTALKNTARWQLSSSILHGFVGALQGAYGYAQDLDKSLNSIRIVTGQSADQMALLAENANKSAQALSTSTLAYTDAALIYYQQGLGDEEVQKRVETTLKMSNVTGESAENVSSYMTAIWNNFAEGSDNLELFADKITALGAATASSSEEIANGLQQFAALGSSLGLSYDDATAALATVVAQTRQSASTVGNSFRTLFQRIESLALGETLEDGVDLTKYSKALSKVGVQVLDTNGDLRDMHDVIMDLGAAWEGLSKAQRDALAQTVGGVRNANTLIAWMDNFNKFQDNLGVVANAEGTLQEQADIYAESWEAARKRVQASWQALYQDLIDDKFFTAMLNGIEKILNGVDRLIDSIGGLPGVLGAVGVIITTVFNKQLVGALQNAQQQFKVFSGTAQAESNAMTLWVKNNLDAFKADDGVTDSTALSVNLTKQRLALTIQLRDIYDQLTDAQRQYAEELLTSVERQQQLTLEAKRTAEATKEQAEDAMRQLRSSTVLRGNNDNLTSYLSSGELNQQIALLNQLTKGTEEWNIQYDFIINSFRSSLQPIGDQEKLLIKVVDAQVKAAESEKEYANAKQTTQKEVILYNQRLQELVEGHHNGTISTQELIAAIEQEEQQLISEQGEVARTTEEYKKLEEQKRKLQQSNQGILGPEFAQNVVSGFRGVSQLTMGINSLSSAFEALSNKDLSFFDKLQRFSTGLSFGAPSLLSGGSKIGKNIGDIFNSVSGYLDQKKSNGILDQMINDNISRINEIKNTLGDSTNKIWFDEDSVFQVAALKQEMKGLDEANKALSSGIQGGVSVWADLSGIWGKVLEKGGGLLTKFGPLALKIAAVAAAAYALKVAWDSWYASTPEGKLEAANKALEEAKQKTEETAEAYKKVKDSLEEYANAREKISQMEAGEERAEAIADENDKILELIDSLDAWKDIGALEYDANGLIELSKEQSEILERDHLREASLARQAEYQAKINQLTAQADKDYKDNYSGTKIQLSREDGTFTETTTSTGTYTTANRQNIDVTREIAGILNQRGLNIKSDRSEIESAIVDSNKYTADEIANVLLPKIEEIANNTELTKEFDELQQDEITNNASIDAYQTENARRALGSDLSDLQFEEAQNALIQNFAALDAERQQKITEAIIAGQSLTEAWTEAAQIIQEATNNVRQELIDKISTANGGEGNNREDVANWINGLDEDDLKIVSELEIEYDDTLEEVKHKFSEALNNTPVEFDTSGLTKKQAQEAQEEFERLTDYIQENAGAIDELDDHLEDCRREASQVAKAIMRFDDAIQDVTENYDDWNRALKTGSMQEAAKAANQMTKAYGNLLDIDGSVLSSDFLEDAKNLDLMKAAIEGNEDAYMRLQEIANQDIIAHLELSPEDLTNFNNQLDLVKGLLVDQNFPDLEVGANLDTGNFLTALTDMVNAAHMTQKKATAYLANMGIDAEVTKVPAETQTVTENRKYWVPATYEWKSHTSGMHQAGDMGVDIVPTLKTAGHWEPETSSHEEESSPTAFSLKVTSAHKSSGGGFKFKNASSGGGAAPKKSSGRGGGGGGGSAKTPEVKEHVKDEDRYHDIKERIDDLSKATDRLNKTRERTYGKSRLKYINDEIKALDKQIELTDEYIKEIRKYLALDKGNLIAINMGATFDENGMLTNYEDVLKNINATYNKAIDVYNESAQEEADKKILEKAQKTYEENKKILKQYEDTYNLLQEQIQTRIDQINEKYDKELAKIDWEVQLQLDFDERDRKLLQWIFDNMGDGADRAADKIANLSEQMKTLEKDWKASRKGIEDIFAFHGIEIDFEDLNSDELVAKLQEFMRNEKLQSELTTEEGEQLEKYLDGLMSTYTEMKEAADEVHEVLADAIDSMVEAFDKGNEKIEQAGNIMKHYSSIVDLTGRKLLKLSSSELRKMSQQIVKNAQDALGAAKAQMEEWRDQMEDAQKLMLKYQLEGDEQSYKYWKEHFERLEELYTDATENYYSAWEEALQAVNDALEKSLDLMQEDYNDAFGDLGLDYIAEQFKVQQELSELYLPDYKKYHELNASVRKLNKSLQDTNNTLIKGKMNDLLDEINAKMAAGVKISEYEAGIIERRIALLQAEAQLRDAQQAKSAVRMTRDNEGNFSYTYTADQDAIGDAEENYAEAVYDYQDYMVSMSNDLQSQWIEWNQYFNERYREILDTYKEGTEERRQAVADLMEEYNEKMLWFNDQMGVLFDEQKRFRDDDWADIENIVQMKLLSDEDLITSFDRTVLSAITGTDTLTDLMDTGEAAWEDMLATGEDALRTWQDNTAMIFEEAGTTVDDFSTKAGQDLEEVAEESAETKASIYDMVHNPDNGISKVLEDAKEAARDFDDTYGKYMTNIQNSTAKTVAALQDMLKKLHETFEEQQRLAEQATRTAAAIQAANNASTGSGGGSSGGSGGGGGGGYSGFTPQTGQDDNPKGKTSTQYIVGYQVRNPSGSTYSLSAYIGPSSTGDDNNKKNQMINYAKTSSQYGTFTLQKKPSGGNWSNIATYVKSKGSSGSGSHGNTNRQMYMSTGGYTGDWPTDSGRLAVLHKKELVLNKDDTANMLKAVDFVRQMTQSIGTQNLFKNNINYSGISAVGAMSGALEQNVHIDASFPNVESHTEIELALNNLINSATQYVNRK